MEGLGGRLPAGPLTVEAWLTVGTLPAARSCPPQAAPPPPHTRIGPQAAPPPAHSHTRECTRPCAHLHAREREHAQREGGGGGDGKGRQRRRWRGWREWGEAGEDLGGGMGGCRTVAGLASAARWSDDSDGVYGKVRTRRTCAG